MGAYEQKLHIRRDDAGNVAKQTEALLLHGASSRKCRGYIHRKRAILLREVCRQSVSGTSECQRRNIIQSRKGNGCMVQTEVSRSRSTAGQELMER
jgi:hypothetical protein